jgi:hypothetical protein
MPRNVRYQKSFQAQNGIYFRLQIIPGDNTIFNYASATTVELADETVLTINDIEISYRDGLPFGFPEYAPLEIEFNVEELPDDLKTYITTGFKPGTETSDLINSNIAILWSSSDNISYQPIWLGIQTPQIVSSITVSRNVSTIIKVTFQAIQTTVLLRCKWQLLNKYFDDPDTFDFKEFDYYIQEYIRSHVEWQELFVEPPQTGSQPTFSLNLTNQFGNDRPQDNFFVYPYRLKEIFEVMRREIQAVFKYITRQATTIVRSNCDKTTTYFDWEYDRYIGSSGVVKVRQAQTTITDYYDRLGNYLAFNQLFVPFIIDPGSNTFGNPLLLTKAKYAAAADTNSTVGGIFNINDKGSFPSCYKTFVEFFVALAEWSCSKMLIKFAYSAGVIKMNFEVFGSLEKTNTTLPVSLELFDISSSESLTAEIGYICSSVETGNAKATPKLFQIPAQSPLLPDLAKSQTFSIKNCAFSWDCNIIEPVAADAMKPSVGTYEEYWDPNPETGTYKGFRFQNFSTIPCTTLFYAQGTLKITEYVQIGDTTKTDSEDIIYYETSGFVPNHMDELIAEAGEFLVIPRYLELYQWLSKYQLLFGTAVQMNKVFSKILTNPKNWTVKDAEIYHVDQIDLGMPNSLIGHKIENDFPLVYDSLLDPPNKGIITSVKYELLTGKYTLGSFQCGFLMEV